MSKTASLTIQVTDNGKGVSNAKIRVDGPNGQHSSYTANGNGTIQLRNLAPGKYIANAAKRSTFYGNGMKILKPGDRQTIRILYPPPVKKSSLEVRVVWSHGATMHDQPRVSIHGPSRRRPQSAIGGRTSFGRIEPGQYGVSAMVTLAGGILVQGYATVNVPPGAFKSVTVTVAPADPGNGTTRRRIQRDIKDAEAKKWQLDAKIRDQISRYDMENQRNGAVQRGMDGKFNAVGEAIRNTMRYYDIQKMQVESDGLKSSIDRMRNQLRQLDQLDREGKVANF